MTVQGVADWPDWHSPAKANEDNEDIEFSKSFFLMSCRFLKGTIIVFTVKPEYSHISGEGVSLGQ